MHLRIFYITIYIHIIMYETDTHSNTRQVQTSLKAMRSFKALLCMIDYIILMYETRPRPEPSWTIYIIQVFCVAMFFFKVDFSSVYICIIEMTWWFQNQHNGRCCSYIKNSCIFEILHNLMNSTAVPFIIISYK